MHTKPINPKIKLLVLFVLVAIILVIGFLFYRSSQFRIVRTDPKLSSVSKVAPYLRVYFNDAIDSSSLKVSDPDSIIGSTKINNKSVVFYFKENLVKDIRYTITIRSIKNEQGELLINKPLTFVAKNIGYDKLSKEQQQTLVARQDAPIYEVQTIDFTNFDSLLDYGITSGQLLNIKNAIYDYSNIKKAKYWHIPLNTKSVVITNHNAASADTLERADFTITLGGALYKVHVEYQGLYDSVYLQLFDAAGVVVYDSSNGEDL